MFDIQAFYDKHINELTTKINNIQNKIDSFVARNTGEKVMSIQDSLVKYGGTATETLTLPTTTTTELTLTLYPKLELETHCMELCLYSELLRMITVAHDIMKSNPDPLFNLVPYVHVLDVTNPDGQDSQDSQETRGNGNGQEGGIGVFTKVVCGIRNCFHASQTIAASPSTDRMKTIHNGLFELSMSDFATKETVEYDTRFGARLEYTINKIPERFKGVASSFQEYCTRLFADAHMVVTPAGYYSGAAVLEAYIAYLISSFIELAAIGNKMKARGLENSRVFLNFNIADKTYVFAILIMKDDSRNYIVFYQLLDNSKQIISQGIAREMHQFRSVTQALQISPNDVSITKCEVNMTRTNSRAFEHKIERVVPKEEDFEKQLKDILGIKGLTLAETAKLTFGFTSIVEDPGIIEKLDLSHLISQVPTASQLQPAAYTPSGDKYTIYKTLVHMMEV